MHHADVLERLDARVALGQAFGDAFEHPRAAEIQAIEMRELRIGRIRDDDGPQPLCGTADRGNVRQKSAEPPREFDGRQNPPHQIRFGKTR